MTSKFNLKLPFQNILKGSFCALIFSLSHIFSGFWFFAVFGYSAFLFFTIKSKPSKLSEYFQLSMLSLSFYFVIRFIELRGLFPALNSLLTNQFKAVLVFIGFCLYHSILAMVWSPVISALHNFVKSKIIAGVLTIGILLLANYLNLYITAESHEMPLMFNSFLIASIGKIGTLPVLIFLFLCSYILTQAVLNQLNRTASIVSIIILTIAIYGIGYFKIRNQNIAQNSQTVFLVQTGQSSYLPNNKFKLETVLNSIKTSISNANPTSKPIIIFPEYTFEEDINTLNEIKQFQEAISTPTRIVAGFYHTTNNGIVNELIGFNEESKIIKRVGKVILFPIGEAAVEYPLIPSDWTRPVVPVIASENPDIIEFSDIVLMPMICFESTIETFYASLLKKASTIANKRKFFLNVSKDSFLEQTSALDYFSFFTRTRASLYDTPMIRVSTPGHTEIFSNDGSILASTHSSNLEILRYDIRGTE